MPSAPTLSQGGRCARPLAAGPAGMATGRSTASIAPVGPAKPRGQRRTLLRINQESLSESAAPARLAVVRVEVQQFWLAITPPMRHHPACAQGTSLSVNLSRQEFAGSGNRSHGLQPDILYAPSTFASFVMQSPPPRSPKKGSGSGLVHCSRRCHGHCHNPGR